jgi:Fur family ferric uptake transcriptional regulator
MAALDGASEPLSAAGVLARIGGCCDLATVYRSLGYLEGTGRAESFVLHCSEHGTERYFASTRAVHRHWFHCETCHRFIDLGACRIGGLAAELERELGLSVRAHTLYFSGICADCKTRAGSTAGQAGPRSAPPA